jgi:hypothetical protein
MTNDMRALSLARSLTLSLSLSLSHTHTGGGGDELGANDKGHAGRRRKAVAVDVV